VKQGVKAFNSTAIGGNGKNGILSSMLRYHNPAVSASTHGGAPAACPDNEGISDLDAR